MNPDILAYPATEKITRDLSPITRHCFCDPLWIRAFENFSGIAMEPHHLAVTRDGRPSAFMPAYIQRSSLSGTLGLRLFGRLSYLPPFHQIGASRSLVCAAPWAYYSGIEGDPASAAADHAALLAQMDRMAQERRLWLTGFPFVPETSEELIGRLEAHGYRRFPNLPTTYLDLGWKDFNEYVNHLPHNKTRRSIRKERQRGKELQYEWYEGSHLEDPVSGIALYKRLLELYNQTWRKHNYRPTPLRESFLPELWKFDRPNLRLCLARYNGAIVAFCLLRVYAGRAHAFMVGQDYRSAGDLPVYFNTFFYEPIERGIAEGWKTIYFRPGVYQSKLRRGCKVENLFLYVKAHKKLARRLLDFYIPRAYDRFQQKWTPPSLYRY